MLGFIVGCLTGGIVGVTTMCCMVSAGDADRR
ncbi:MAG: DUF3789 domain-containing protein [Oscillospiraceae bacterium]|jgi:hypothetical protein|nr:DUF3789 domain-containing protein [Oscillospiraceae bacterium]MBQ5338216.1 DUF3789 domain-containing protein [Oscillospiraceae bacterium]MBQ9908096.1 DUF3789 domain-containing protein [Oscillospiraceae bacterium]MBR5364462.1 DUF3789 domain-containing protein [Oscillospiraceae bacterium]